jgi:hypothetical protein
LEVAGESEATSPKGLEDAMKLGCPKEEQIRARAYEIYRARGGQPGHDMDDWLQAEYELIQLPIRKIAELQSTVPKRHAASQLAIVSLVEAAMLLGAEAFPHLK